MILRRSWAMVNDRQGTLCLEQPLSRCSAGALHRACQFGNITNNIVTDEHTQSLLWQVFGLKLAEFHRNICVRSPTVRKGMLSEDGLCVRTRSGSDGMKSYCPRRERVLV